MPICPCISHMKDLGRVATVSKLWAASYKASLFSDKQRLKALAAQTPLPINGVVPQQPLLGIVQ